MVCDETQLKYDYLKWSIDRSNNYLVSFRNRIFEIIAMNTIVISISSSIAYYNITALPAFEFRFLKLFTLSSLDLFLFEALLFILLFFGEIICLIYVSIPRKSKTQLSLKEKIDETIKNMEEYDKSLKFYLKNRAIITRTAYRMFFAQLFIIFSFFIINIFSYSTFRETIITLTLILETFLVLTILIIKEKYISIVLEKTIEKTKLN